jgi:hypothetical protein
MAGIKITLAPLVLLILLPLLAGSNLRWSARAGLSALFVIVAPVTFLGVLITYYMGRLDLIPIHFRMLADFVRHAGSEERFWASLFLPHSPAANPGADYGYARVALVLWLAALIAAFASLRSAPNRERAVRATTAVVLAAVAVWGLVTRPAGTTLWEVMVGLLVAAACTVVTLPPGAPFRAVRVTFCAGLIAAAGWGGIQRFQQGIPLPRLGAVSNAIWESHHDLMAGPVPHVFVFIDGNHVVGAVAESLMKGCQDFPSSRMAEGQTALRLLGGDLQILMGSPAAAPAQGSVLVARTPGETFPTLEQGRPMTSWDVTLFPWWPRTLALYRPPFPETTK